MFPAPISPRPCLVGHVLMVPPISPFVDSVFSPEGPRVRIELTDNAARVAQELGQRNFQGDAFTITARVPNAGSAPTFTHVLYIQDTCFDTTGKLVVVLMHELMHMERRERGIPLTTNAEEERAVFAGGIAAAEGLVQVLQATLETSPQASAHREIAREINLALAEERRLLAHWLRSRR